MKKSIFIITLLSFVISTAQQDIKILKSFDTIEVSVKTIEEAVLAFNYIKNAPIQSETKKEQANNCENKASFSFMLLKKLGFKPIVFWLFKEGFVEDEYNTLKKVKKSKGLTFNTGIGRKPFVFWGYHVAAGVLIDGEIYIYDPWTQDRLVKLNQWALSFYPQEFDYNKKRTAYIFQVNDSYKYFGTDNLGKLSVNKSDWLKNIDSDEKQMYCGLAGITPNGKCSKNRFRKRILQKRKEIELYINNILEL